MQISTILLYINMQVQLNLELVIVMHTSFNRTGGQYDTRYRRHSIKRKTRKPQENISEIPSQIFFWEFYQRQHLQLPT